MVVKEEFSEVPDLSTWRGRIRWMADRFEGGNLTSAAKRWGMSPQAVAKQASGKSDPSADTLAAILRSYPTLNPDWLLLGEGEPERAAPVPREEAVEALEEVYRVIHEARDKYARPRDPITTEPDADAERMTLAEVIDALPPPAETPQRGLRPGAASGGGRKRGKRK